MVTRLGSKWTLVAGVAFYLVWLAANCAPHPCTLLPAAASVGLGESLLWTAQVTLGKCGYRRPWQSKVDEKLCYRRRTARLAMSVKILSTVERNILYNESTTNRNNGVEGLQLTDL